MKDVLHLVTTSPVAAVGAVFLLLITALLVATVAIIVRDGVQALRSRRPVVDARRPPGALLGWPTDTAACRCALCADLDADEALGIFPIDFDLWTQELENTP
jgi:hypothetical protein